MARNTILAWSVVTVAILSGTPGEAGPLTRPSGFPAVLPPPRPADPVSASSGLDLRAPDLPAAPAGFDAPPSSGGAGFAALTAAPGGAAEPWIVPQTAMQAIFAQSVSLRVGLPAEAEVAPAPTLATSATTMVEGELGARDTSLARIAILPPPRPAFLPTRTALAPTGRGIVEAMPRARPEGWSEVASAGPDAITALSGRPERTVGSGVASWYGPGFHGRKTASGERFDQHALTAAHPSLPFGTKVKVVDEKSGRSIVVRINDRGPFAHGRVIDLSKASAKALGMNGLARVKIVRAD